MRNTKRWLAVLLSASMVLNTGMVSTAAAVTDGVQPVTENEAVDGQEVDGQEVDGQEADAGAGQTENADAGQTENQQGGAGDAKTGDQEDGAAEEVQTPEQPEDGTTEEQQPTDAIATQEGEEGQEEVANFITEIATEEDLLEFAKNVAEGHTYADETVTLKNDIALTAAWAPIGGATKDTSFQGTFDGGEHTITVMAADSSARQWGLFKANYGTIQKLTLAGTVKPRFKAGSMAYENYGIIKSCANKMDISTSYVGGIVYDNKGSGVIEACANYGVLSTGTVNGIASDNAGRISSCFNGGRLTSLTDSANGLVYSNTGVIENSYCTSQLSVTYRGYVYGIANSNYRDGNEIKNCYFGGFASPTHVYRGSSYVVSNATGVSNSYMLEGAATCFYTDAPKSHTKADAEMRKKEFAETLGDAYKVNPNNGYPLLLWQTENGTEEPVELKNIALSHRTSATTVDLTAEALTSGTLYYLAQDTDAAAPTADEVVAKGTGTECSKGQVELEATVTSEKEQTVYLVLQAGAGYLSEVYQATMEKWSVPSLTRIQVADNGELAFAAASRSVQAVCDTDVTDLTFNLLFSDGDGTGLDISYTYTDADGNEQTVKEVTPGEEHTFQNFLKKDVNGNALKITASANGESQEYTVRVVRRAVLQNLQAADQDGKALTLTPAFDKSVADYEIFADDTATEVKLTVEQPTELKAKVRYNDTESEDGTYTQKLTSEKTDTVTIEVANSAAKHTVYTVQINKTLADIVVDRKTDSAKVTFQAGAAGTVYYQVGEAGAEVTAESLKTSGQSQTVTKGENTLGITGLANENKYLYLCFVNEQVTSDVHQVDLLKVVDPYFTSITFYADVNETATIDPNTGEGTVVLNSDLTSITARPSVPGGHGPDADTYYTWLDKDGNEVTKKHTKGAAATPLDNMLQKTVEPSDLKIYCTKAGEAPQTYIIHIQRRAVVSALQLTDQNGKMLTYTPSRFAPASDGSTYSVMVWDDVDSVNIRVTDPTTSNPTFKFNDTEVNGDTYTVNLKDGQSEKITITPVNEKAAGCYSYNLVINRMLSDFSATYRKEDSVRIGATAGIAGEVYYVVQAPDAEAPNADTVMEKGKHSDRFIKGDNELILSGIGKDAKKVYLLLEDNDGNCSKVYGIDVKAYEANLLDGFKSSLSEDTVSFNFETKAADITAATNLNSLTFTPVLPDGAEGAENLKLVYSYTGTDGSDKSLEKTVTDTVTFTDLLGAETKVKDLTIKVSGDGKAEQTYVVHIAREAVLTDLKVEDQDGNALTLTPEFNASQTEYDAILPDETSKVTFTVKDPTNETPNLAVKRGKEVTGPSWEEKVSSYRNIENYKIQVKNEEAEGRVYTLNLRKLCIGEYAQNRTHDAVDITFTSGIDGKVYYLLQEVGAEAPDLETVIKDGKAEEVTKGENTLELKGIEDTAYTAYLVVKNDQYCSSVKICDIKQFYPLAISLGSGQVSFDWKTKTATCTIPVSDSSSYQNARVTIPNRTSSSPTQFSYEYTDADGQVKKGTAAIGSWTTFDNLTKPMSSEGNDVKLSITVDGEVQEYTLHVIRNLIITQMSAKDQNDHTLSISPRFSSDTKEYEVYMYGDTTSVIFTAKDPMSGTDLCSKRKRGKGKYLDTGCKEQRKTDCDSKGKERYDRSSNLYIEAKSDVKCKPEGKQSHSYHSGAY